MAVEAEATMVAQGSLWSSLPADLVNRVADCLLATSDLDYYMDLRAVCQHWRSSTADPRSNQHDPRFRPSRWVLLDGRKLSSSSSDDHDTVLFVNTATGRFLRKSLQPFLHRHRYDFVTTTTGGLLVLAARDSTPKHAARVLNPFTGSIIHFAAPVPPDEERLTAEVVGSSPTLALASVYSSDVYWAEPQSESFSVENHENCPASRLPLIAAAKCDAAVRREPDREGNKIFDDLASSEDCRCYVVPLPLAAGGDMLAVFNDPGMFGVLNLKLDVAGNVMGRVTSFGGLALFLGVRCLAVDADSFPTIEPNCIYFQAHCRGTELSIYRVDITGTLEEQEQEPELVEEAADYSYKCVALIGNEADFGAPYWCAPFTLTQILSDFTMIVPHRHPPAWGGRDTKPFPKYIDYINPEDRYATEEDWDDVFQDY